MLRKWQAEALELFRTKNPKDFLVTATPGAGKTTFALTVADNLLKRTPIEQVIIVVPTDHLRTQWSDAAISKGIFIDPSLSNSTSLLGEDFVGYVVTYDQVANNPGIHMARTTSKRTLVIFDEIHHAGEGLSWGNAVKLAFFQATRRLSLTGTPFRTSPEERIPFVNYVKTDDGGYESYADYTYGYKEALADGVVRPVTFAAYSGTSSWTNSAGETMEANLLGEELSKKDEQHAWRGVLSPKGQWLPHVIKAADDRLDAIRKAGIKDAGGMILASNQDDARDYAKILKRITKLTPTIILSDDRKASRKIKAFSESENPNDKWLVAVRMVSEGVDVPRLCVGIWATNYRTPLFFAQAVGRFVRSRKPGEVATVFLPAVRPLLSLAANLEEQRKHIIPPPEDKEDLGEVEVGLDEPEDFEDKERGEFIAHQSNAEFAHVLMNGKSVVGNVELDDEDYDIIGLDGLLSPEQMANILKAHDKQWKEETTFSSEDKKIEDPRVIYDLRKQINKQVSRIALRSNANYATIHNRTRKEVPGPPTASAPIAVLQKRLEYLERS